MNTIYLTEKHIESLMTGEIVSIEGPLNFSTKIVPPDNVRDTCHVSWSLHVATRDRMKEDFKVVSASASSAWEEVDKLRERIAEVVKERDEARRVVAYEQQRRREDEGVWLETRDANKRLQAAYDDIRVKYMRLTT